MLQSRMAELVDQRVAERAEVRCIFVVTCPAQCMSRAQALRAQLAQQLEADKQSCTIELEKEKLKLRQAADDDRERCASAHWRDLFTIVGLVQTPP